MHGAPFTDGPEGEIKEAGFMAKQAAQAEQDDINPRRVKFAVSGCRKGYFLSNRFIFISVIFNDIINRSLNLLNITYIIAGPDCFFYKQASKLILKSGLWHAI